MLAVNFGFLDTVELVDVEELKACFVLYRNKGTIDECSISASIEIRESEEAVEIEIQCRPECSNSRKINVMYIPHDAQIAKVGDYHNIHAIESMLFELTGDQFHSLNNQLFELSIDNWSKQ